MEPGYRISVWLDGPGTRSRCWNVAVQTVHTLSRTHDRHRDSGENDPSNARWLDSANAADKSCFWRDLETQRGVFRHQVIVGEPLLTLNCRFSPELLADMESLLIRSIAPWGNIQCRNSRICRPDLTVRCMGDWPRPKKLFHDS